MKGPSRSHACSQQPIREQDPPGQRSGESPAVGGLHPNVIVDFVLDSALVQRLEDGLHRGEEGQRLVGHHTHLLGSQVPQVLQENRQSSDRNLPPPPQRHRPLPCRLLC